MYRSKRVSLVVRDCDSGELTCDTLGNIYRKGKCLREHLDYDGYRAIYIQGVEVPSHLVISYLKHGDSSIEEGIVTRHLDNDKLNNSWSNIGIGTPTENNRDIPAYIRRDIAIQRWRRKTFSERRKILLKVSSKTSNDKKRKRAIRASSLMTLEDRKKGHKTRKLVIKPEICYFVIHLKDRFSMNYLSKVFQIPLSQVIKILNKEGKYSNL